MRTGVAKDKAKDKNVVHARLKRMGLRFELSVYRDKVPSKQDLASKDFHPNWLEILAAQVVFSNAAKNEVADKNDLAKAFPEMQDVDIFRQILEKGDIQATLEDRNEHMAESIHTLAKLSVAIAAMTHVRPSEEDAQDKKKKHRLTRYTPQDLERELKNIRYKHDAAMPLHDQSVDAIAAIHRANNLPIFRDARAVTINGPSDVMSEVPKALAAATSLFRPCDFKVLRVTQDTILAVADYSLDVAALSKKDGTLAQASWSTTDEFYVPTHPDGSDDLTPLTAATTATAKQQPSGGGGGGGGGAKKGSDGPKPKPSAKNSQKKGDAGSDDDDDEGDAHHRRGLGSLEDELKRLQRDDSDDEGRGKGKGKAKGGKQPAAKQAAVAPKPAPPAKATGSQKTKGGRRDEFDSDEGDER